MKRREAGFTLTELMVVVAIIGVLVTMAIVYMRPRVRSIDVATRVGDLVREGSRRAIALGPVRADVATALGSKARTQILATQTGTPLVVTFTLYRLEEGAPGVGVWQPIESYTVHPNVLPVRWEGIVNGAAVVSTTWGPPPTVPPATPPPTPPGSFSAQCRPDGTCDARSLFFQAAINGPAYEQLAKISIMPLGGAIRTSTDWN